MSFIYKILDHDLHKTKLESDKIRLFFTEIPGRSEFLPCVVSTIDKGRFLINRNITKDGRIRAGIFHSSEETLDEIIPKMLNEAFRLSTSSNYKNVFTGSKKAFDYVTRMSGLSSQPHYCILPSRLDEDKLNGILKPINRESDMINGICRVIKADVDAIVFLSRPDFVGLYTRYPNNQNSVILHNVEMGMSFCVY